jgi:hypothetical protein
MLQRPEGGGGLVPVGGGVGEWNTVKKKVDERFWVEASIA